MNSYVEHSEYKGNPMLVITTGKNDKYPFQFGLKKAEMILQHIGDIRAFVAMYTPESGK